MSSLEPFRRRLDELDERILGLFGQRFEVCREVAEHKRQHDIPVMAPGRVEQVRARYETRGAAFDLPADFTRELFELLIAATCALEADLIELPAHAPKEL